MTQKKQTTKKSTTKKKSKMKLFLLRDTEVIHYEMLEIIIVKKSIEEVNEYLNKFSEEYLTALEEDDSFNKCHEICKKYNLFFGFSENDYCWNNLENYGIIDSISCLKVIVESETNLPEGVVCSLSVGG